MINERTATVRLVDLVFSVPQSPAAAAAMKQITAAVKNAPTAHATTLTSGSLLPKSSRGEFYTWFHIDDEERTGESASRDFFAHLMFKRRPEGAPPPNMAKLKKDGRTAEWLLKSLDAVVGKENPFVLVETELRLVGWSKPRTPLVAPPLTSGATVLEVTGAEYRGERAVGAVNHFRWSTHRSGAILVWASYVIRWTDRSRDPWNDERERCLKYKHETYIAAVREVEKDDRAERTERQAAAVLGAVREMAVLLANANAVRQVSAADRRSRLEQLVGNLDDEPLPRTDVGLTEESFLALLGDDD